MSASGGIIETFDRHLAATLRGAEPAWPFAPAEADCNALWQRIQFHGIAGLLAPRPTALQSWPLALRERVADEARTQAFWEESHRAMLVALLADLARRKIPALVMKGSALAYALYDDPSARRRGDSDLLVRQSDLQQVRAALAALGCHRRADPHGLFFQESWLLETGIGLIHAIDLHWQPSDSPVVQQVLRAEEYFARLIPLPRLSADAAMPDMVLTFLHGAINQAWHAAHGYFVGEARMAGGGRLIWAWDNHLLAGAFSPDEWQELAELATARSAGRVCLAALDLAQQNCGTAIPAWVLQRLRSSPQAGDLLDHLSQTNIIAAFLTDVAAMASLRAKCSFIIGHAFPGRRHLQQKYPQAAGWPLPLLHLRRIGEAAVRLVRLS